MTLLIGILLALACALTTNVGFLFKHRGARTAPPVDIRRPLFTARSLFASRLFTVGMVIATGAWILHIAAMAMAPLSVVQAVLASGVVLLAIMAERMLGLSISRRQWIGIGLTALGLLLLGLSLPPVHGAHSRFSVPGMIGFESVLLGAGLLLIMGPRIGVPAEHHGFMVGAAAGILFGVSDVAIKAIAGIVGAHGIAGFLTPWMLVTIVPSIAAFFASAKAFQDGDAVPVIAVTGTACNVTGIIGGIIVFGDPIAAQPLMMLAELTAFALVVVAAWLTPAPVRGARPQSAGAPA